MITSGFNPSQRSYDTTNYSIPTIPPSRQSQPQTAAKTLQQPTPKPAQQQPQIIPRTAPQTDPKLDPEPAPKPAQQQPQTAPEKSTERVHFRLTKKQRSQLKKLQKKWGLATESAVVKRLIDESKEEENTATISAQIEELTRLRTELNRIGVNINQIAKKANQVQMTRDDLNAAMRYMNDVVGLIYQRGGE